MKKFLLSTSILLVFGSQSVFCQCSCIKNAEGTYQARLEVIANRFGQHGTNPNRQTYMERTQEAHTNCENVKTDCESKCTQCTGQSTTCPDPPNWGTTFAPKTTAIGDEHITLAINEKKNLPKDNWYTGGSISNIYSR